ncbi:type IV secretion system protein TraC [Enterovibrio norvegicus]|uniref:Type IV secretion system protein TraC n=1 Tax=Enterovibrio norvegicus TaxID=188144 RepID=A0ABV4L7U1_9GAMM
MGAAKDLTGFYRDAKRQHNHLHAELPYRTFDAETNLFYNKKGIGFGFELSVLGGANEDMVEAFNRALMDLPSGNKWDYHVSMLGHNQVHHYIERNASLKSERGGICKELAEQELAYGQYAANNGFFHRQKHYFDIKDYRAWLFVSTTDDFDNIIDCKEAIYTGFLQMGLDLTPMKPEHLISYVEGVLNFKPNQKKPNTPHYSTDELIYKQIMSPDTEFLTRRTYTDIRFTDGDDLLQSPRLVGLGLRSRPRSFRLYNLPECFASVRNVAKSVQCPHLLTLNWRNEDIGSFSNKNGTRINELDKTLKSPMAFFFPQAEKEMAERKQIRDEISDGINSVSKMQLTLTLFTDKKNERIHRQSAINAFRSGGLDMQVVSMLQSQSLLSILPFMMTDGFWTDCDRAGRIHTVKTSNVVNLLPVLLDVKNFSGGMMLPTMRQQAYWFNPFNCGSDNYNIALTGGSGAGKSFFVQKLAETIYSMNGKVWVLDKGQSFKKLTLMLHGSYMTAEKIYLNPFTHLETIAKGGSFTDESGEEINPLKETLHTITGLFATMACPTHEMGDLERSVLADCIIKAWEKYKGSTLVDHVQDALFSTASEMNDDRRISDIAIQLNKYRSDGIYGDTFNKPSMLDPDVHFTTIELDGFPSDVMRPVIFALMSTITQQMYLSGSRSTPKMCIIEEAWSLMAGSNAQAQEFINTGYRTARKFGGCFCTVTQGIKDFFSTPEAMAAFNNSDIHITLRQGEGFNDFLKENPNHFSPFEQTVIKNFEKSGVAGYSSVMLKAGGHVTFHRFFADPFTRACLSTEPHEFEYCEKLMNKGTPLMEAVNMTAKKFYGDEIDRFNSLVKGKDAA